jgi:hypothetical protein
VATALNVDNVPTIARPKPVAAALEETQQLRQRFADAQAQVKAAEGLLERQKQIDIEAAAVAIREGKDPRSSATEIKRRQDQLAKAQREVAIVELALLNCEADASEAIKKSGSDWVKALDEKRELAKKQALAAVDAFEQALAELRASVAARNWLDNALQTSRFDARVPSPLLGSQAPSSARVAASSHAFFADDIIGWARELADPPPPAQRRTLSGDVVSDAA